MTCPTCGFFLGQKTEEYENKKLEICSNPKYSKKQADEEISNLIKTIGLRRYCCKMRLRTYKDLIEEILPVSENK